MAKNANFVSHKKSKQIVDGKPKLPLASDLVEGEIAINFGKDVETLSIKNESGDVVTFSSDNYYTEQKLGSGFTGENSGVTVTEALENIEITVDQDFSNTASTNPISTKAVYSAVTDNELVWTNAFVTLSGTVSAHTEDTSIHVTSADKEKINSIDTLSGKTLTQVTSSNNSISAFTAVTSDGTVKADIQTDASKISGLTAVSDSDEGAAKISGVTSTSSVKKGIENLYKSIASEVAARKAAILARAISSANKAITVTETPNADGFATSIALTLDTSTNGKGDEMTGDKNSLTITNNGLFLSTNWTCGNY